MDLNLYEKLLTKTSQEYLFAKICGDLNTAELKKSSKKVCFLRHDIDFDPINALRMARLEAETGAVSTYTVLLSGQYYNPFEKRIKDTLKELKNYGHEVGLHFDPTVYEIKNESELEKYIRQESEVLQDLLDLEVEMFSFHNTTDFSMSCRKEQYGGLVNVYSNFFHDEVQYTSDSNGHWRFRTWEELLSQSYKIIQVLTHPIWWQPNNELPPFETVVKCCLDRFRRNINDYNSMFDGQESRINKSALTHFLKNNDKQNTPLLLNEYSEFPGLIKFLFSEGWRGNKQLIDIASRFWNKWK
jgi:hypothetical protein